MRQLHYILFSFLFILLYAQKTGAQNTISGEVVDRSNAPVPGTLINFDDGAIRTTSDIEGKFSLTYSDTIKNRRIFFEAFGYKNKSATINKNQSSIRIVLIDSTFNLQSVTISAPKYGRFSDYSAQTIQMSTFDIITNPAAMADMIGNMRVLPGVQVNDNDGRLIIQGGSSEESQIYINDLLVMNPYNLTSKNTGVRTRFSSDLFEGVALQSGGYNAEFGQALSGIVNLNTKDKKHIESKTDVGVSSVFSSLTHMDQKSSYAYRGSVNYTNTGPYNKLISDDYVWSKYPEQISADLFFAKEFSPDTKLITQAQFSSAALNYTYRNVDSIPFTNDMKEVYFYAQANLYHLFNKNWSLSLGSNLIIDKMSGTEVQNKGDKVENSNIWNHNKITLQYSSDKITNRMGAEYIFNPFNETYSFERNNYKMDMESNLLSIYNDTKIFLNNNLTMNLGLRGEYSPYLKQFNLAPRAYIGYRLNRENIISASFGEYFQLPSMNYLKLTNDIDFTSVYKGTLAYSYVEKHSKFQLDTYYKKYNDIITYSQDALKSADIKNNGDGYGWGADVFWKSNLKRLEYWLSYSYSNTEKKFAYYTEKIAPNYAADHSFNITLKYWIGSLKSLIGSNYNISSGTPYYNTTAPYNKLGTTPYRNRLDISWSYLPKPNIIVNFGCQNVLGYTNIYGYNYSQITPGLKKAVTNPDTRFFFLGLFITFSHDKKLNQLKNL
ncbi:MAG: TonB-dependent receptor [Dysgonamonadaceae bacterium]|nr:TonB-dependent receptor [Dysgonamonadaceae bacterium]